MRDVKISVAAASDGALPLPWERAGVRGDGLSTEQSPLTRFAAQIDLSPPGRFCLPLDIIAVYKLAVSI
jgi:hypothetical protein